MSDYYSLKSYRQTYLASLSPIAIDNLKSANSCFSPVRIRPSGRPKTKRLRKEANKRGKRKRHCQICVSDSHDRRTCDGSGPKNTRETLGLRNTSYPRSTRTSGTIGDIALFPSDDENTFNGFSTEGSFDGFSDRGDIEIDVDDGSSLTELENFSGSEKSTPTSQLSTPQSNASSYVLALDNMAREEFLIPTNELKASAPINPEFNNLDKGKVQNFSF